jgi:hypothetical protein
MNVVRCPYGCRRPVLQERLANHWIVEHMFLCSAQGRGLLRSSGSFSSATPGSTSTPLRGMFHRAEHDGIRPR